jgi:hypothetical protein
LIPFSGSARTAIFRAQENSRSCYRASLVERLQCARADDAYVLVAHSHGGSIIHYAYELAPLNFERVVGAACMATPFFAFSIRPGYAAPITAVWAVFLVALLHLLVSAPLLPEHKWRIHLEDSTGWSAALGAAGARMVMALGTIVWAKRKHFHAYFAEAGAFATSLDTTRIRVPHAIFLRSIGDEVALVLSAGELLILIANRILGAMARIADLAVAWVARVAGTTAGKATLALVGTFVGLAAAMPPWYVAGSA